MSEVTSPIILDTTGQDIADALTDVADAINAGNATAAMLAYVENGSTATQPYAKGTYICWQSLLYTADTAINAGDAFYSTGVNKNLTAVGGGGLNSVNPVWVKVADITTVSSTFTQIPFPQWKKNKELMIVINAVNGNVVGSMSVPIEEQTSGGSGNKVIACTAYVDSNNHARSDVITDIDVPDSVQMRILNSTWSIVKATLYYR